MARSVNTAEYDRFRLLLVELRQGAKVGVRELARRLDRPPSYVAKIESGSRRIDVVEFMQLLRALDLRLADVIDRLEPMP